MLRLPVVAALLALCLALPSEGCVSISGSSGVAQPYNCYVVDINQPGEYTIAARTLEALSITRLHKDATLTFTALDNVWGAVTIRNAAGRVAFGRVASIASVLVEDAASVDMGRVELCYGRIDLRGSLGRVVLGFLRAEVIAMTAATTQGVFFPKMTNIWQYATFTATAGEQYVRFGRPNGGR